MLARGGLGRITLDEWKAAGKIVDRTDKAPRGIGDHTLAQGKPASGRQANHQRYQRRHNCHQGQWNALGQKHGNGARQRDNLGNHREYLLEVGRLYGGHVVGERRLVAARPAAVEGANALAQQPVEDGMPIPAHRAAEKRRKRGAHGQIGCKLGSQQQGDNLTRLDKKSERPRGHGVEGLLEYVGEGKRDDGLRQIQCHVCREEQPVPAKHAGPQLARNVFPTCRGRSSLRIHWIPPVTMPEVLSLMACGLRATFIIRSC